MGKGSIVAAAVVRKEIHLSNNKHTHNHGKIPKVPIGTFYAMLTYHPELQDHTIPRLDGLLPLLDA